MTNRTSASLLFQCLLVASALTLVACDDSPTGETSCVDMIDNDMDGNVDCDDIDCIAHTACGASDGGMDDGGPGACSPATCMGCCDADRCVSGMSLAACGQGGGACETCLIGAMCEATGCVGGPVACGPENCDGCCMGDICVPGDRPAACGTGGGACDLCDSWEVCATVCGVDPTGEWQISILDAVIPATDFSGSDWDGIGAGECDPYVELRVGSASATGVALPGIGDTITPDWTEGGTTTVLSPRFTAAEILAFLRFDMFDEDAAFDDTIGMCRYTGGETAFDGEIITLVCDPDAIVETAGFTLRWQLVPG